MVCSLELRSQRGIELAQRIHTVAEVQRNGVRSACPTRRTMPANRGSPTPAPGSGVITAQLLFRVLGNQLA